MLIFGQRHLQLVLAQYEAHYIGRRPHRSRHLHPPRPDHPVADLPRSRSSAVPSSAPSSTNTSGPHRTRVRNGGRVLEPHRAILKVMEKSQRMNPGLPGPSAQTPIWEEPVRGFYTDPGQFVTLSGLDLLRSMLEGGLGPADRLPVRARAHRRRARRRDVHHAGDRLAAVPPGSRLRRHPRHPGGRAVGMYGPDRLASCHSVHHGRDLAQVPAHRRAAERDADGQRPADPRRQDHRRVAGRGHRRSGPPGRGDEHPVRDPAACPGAVGGHRAGAEEPAPSAGAGLAVAPSVRTAGGRRGAIPGDLGQHGRPRRAAVPHRR